MANSIHRNWFLIYSSLIALLIGLVLFTSSGPPKHLSAARIAPEVCQGDGPVKYGVPTGSLLYVHCADGMVKLVQR